MALWDDMLDEFRALGGTADNLCLKDGRFGRGLFPGDPAKPVRLHVPDALLVDVKYNSFEGDTFRLAPGAPVSARERAFLESYQRDFSWGARNGETERLLEMVARAPAELRALFGNPFGFDTWLAGPTPEAARERHFAARQINYNGKVVVMPIIELANHRYGETSYKREDGLSLSGIFEGEVLTRYSFSDALHMFRNFGFASADQPFALSLAMKVDSEAGEILIERGDPSPNPKRKPFFPEMKVEGRRITLSYMMLGHKGFPRLSKGNFYRILRDAGRKDAESAFDKAAQFNHLQLVKLMEASEGAEPALGRLVREVARIQLAAMAHVVGTREV